MTLARAIVYCSKAACMAAPSSSLCPSCWSLCFQKCTLQCTHTDRLTQDWQEGLWVYVVLVARGVAAMAGLCLPIQIQTPGQGGGRLWKKQAHKYEVLPLPPSPGTNYIFSSVFLSEVSLNSKKYGTLRLKRSRTPGLDLTHFLCLEGE